MANDPDSLPRIERDVGKSHGGLYPLLAVIGSLGVGFIAVIAGLLLMSENRMGREIHAVGAGLCFIASALGFGLLANALWRK